MQGPLAELPGLSYFLRLLYIHRATTINRQVSVDCSMHRIRGFSARLRSDYCVAPFRVGSVVPLSRNQTCALRPPSFARRFSSTSAIANTPGAIMDENTKQHYLADSPPTVVRLEVKTHFDNLQDAKLRKYAHFISR